MNMSQFRERQEPARSGQCPAKSAGPARNIERESCLVKLNPMNLLAFSMEEAWPAACFQGSEPFFRPGDAYGILYASHAAQLLFRGARH